MTDVSASVSVSDALAAARSKGEAAVIVTVTDSWGTSAPRRGRRSVVTPRGGSGSLGSPELDALARDLAGRALDTGTELRATWEDGPRGAVLVAEVVASRPAVLVLGSTPTGWAVADLAVGLARVVLLVAPGGGVAVRAGVEVRADDPPRHLLAAPPGPADAVVLADDEASWADEALRIALASPAAYVGLTRGGTAAASVRRRLAAAAVPPRHVDRLRSPDDAPDTSDPHAVGRRVVADLSAVLRAAG